MSYATGDTVQATDYNTSLLAASGPTNYGINYIMGTGAGAYGLGQTALSNVSVSDVITAAQWNSLFTAMDTISNYTNDTLTSTGLKVTGDAIAVKAALQADLNTLAASVHDGCPNATALTTSASLLTITTASEGWTSTATQEVTFTFGSADKARWFFNAGGKIRINVTATATAVDGKDTSYIDLGTGIGNLDIKSQSTSRSGSTEVLTTDGLSLGFHDLTTSYQTILLLTSDNTNYTSNSVQISAKLDAAVGSATVMTVRMLATDGAADTQYTIPNTVTASRQVKNTPKMITTVYSITPNSSEGLVAPAYGLTVAQLSNTTT